MSGIKRIVKPPISRILAVCVEYFANSRLSISVCQVCVCRQFRVQHRLKPFTSVTTATVIEVQSDKFRSMVPTHSLLTHTERLQRHCFFT